MLQPVNRTPRTNKPGGCCTSARLSHWATLALTTNCQHTQTHRHACSAPGGLPATHRQMHPGTSRTSLRHTHIYKHACVCVREQARWNKQATWGDTAVTSPSHAQLQHMLASQGSQQQSAACRQPPLPPSQTRLLPQQLPQPSTAGRNSWCSPCCSSRGATDAAAAALLGLCKLLGHCVERRAILEPVDLWVCAGQAGGGGQTDTQQEHTKLGVSTPDT